ncbi:MAG: hypothetical protein ABMA25_26900 [Ilumatobacteraceae bacterium]
MIRDVQSPDGRWSIVVEDDDRVAYAYLLDGQRIVGDVWLYNVDLAPEDTDWKRQARRPFLQPRPFCLEVPFARLGEDSDVRARWTGDAVVVEIDGVVWARLASGSKPGWSRLAARAGPLAKPLREEE